MIKDKLGIMPAAVCSSPLYGKKERVESKLETRADLLCSAGTCLSRTRGGPARGGDTHLGTGESGSMSSLEDLPSAADGDHHGCPASKCCTGWAASRCYQGCAD